MRAKDEFMRLHDLYMRGQVEQARQALRERLRAFPDEPYYQYLGAVFARYANQPRQTWAQAFKLGFACGHRVPDLSALPLEWTGQSLAGKSVLVIGDQGLGDQVRWSHHLAVIAAEARIVLAYVHPKLVSVFAHNFPGIEFRPLNSQVGEGTINTAAYDFIIPMGDIDGFHAAAPAVLPSGFLSSPRWRGEMGSDQGMAHRDRVPKIAICYRSTKRSADRDVHYGDLLAMQPIFDVPGCDFFSFQPFESEEERAGLSLPPSNCYRVVPDLDLFDDIPGLCAALQEMDLVISTTSYIADVASAVGVPVWRFQGGAAAVALNPWYGALTKVFYKESETEWWTFFGSMAQDFQQWRSDWRPSDD